MRSVLFFLLINIWFCISLQAQSLQETYAKAENLYQNGQYTEAIKLYQRALFFLPEGDSLKPRLYASTAKAFLSAGLYAEAVSKFGDAIYLSQNDSLIQFWRLQKAKAQLLQNHFGKAKEDLDKIDTIHFISLKKSLIFYTAIYYFGVEEYDSAHFYFSKIISRNPQNQNQLDKLFRKNERVKYISPQVAGVMSVIIPGAGQIYSGNFDKGINSLLLTSAFAVLGYNTYVTYGILETSISVLPWYARYYGSGIKNATELAKEKQAQKRQKILNQILTLVAENKNL
jgi:tetratricopeptide (TPR) repeat protein